MSNSLLTEFIEIASAISDLEDAPIPAEMMARLDEICRQYDCRCCGRRSPGRFGPWPNCNCIRFRTCADCNRCLDCCACVDRGELLQRLRDARQLYDRLVNEAQASAINLGLVELEGGFYADDLYDMERLLKAQLAAVRRLYRRWSAWEATVAELGNLGDAATQAEAPECDYANPPVSETVH